MATTESLFGDCRDTTALIPKLRINNVVRPIPACCITWSYFILIRFTCHLFRRNFGRFYECTWTLWPRSWVDVRPLGLNGQLNVEFFFELWLNLWKSGYALIIVWWLDIEHHRTVVTCIYELFYIYRYIHIYSQFTNHDTIKMWKKLVIFFPARLLTFCYRYIKLVWFFTR